LLASVSRIRPGDRGKAGSGWLTRPLLRRVEKHLDRKAGFTSSSGGVRALPVTRKKGLGDEERSRSRSESDQVVQAGFGPGRIAVTQRVMVAAVDQHGRAALAVVARHPPNKRR
jgi:hypothetical protein